MANNFGELSSPKNINQTQQKIIDMILLDPRITQSAMAINLGITSRTVKKSIKELSELGILNRIGLYRNGYWQLNDINED